MPTNRGYRSSGDQVWHGHLGRGFWLCRGDAGRRPRARQRLAPTRAGRPCYVRGAARLGFCRCNTLCRSETWQTAPRPRDRRLASSALASRGLSSNSQHQLFIRPGHLPEHVHKPLFVSGERVLSWNLGSCGFAAPRVKELIKFQIEGLGHFLQGFERRDGVAAFHARDVAA